ncbi:hypothetical protein LIT25_11270 [Bacillus sp. F19]|nr:hypothetical protein LIT25_11270 [Bacillus sp. F19]
MFSDNYKQTGGNHSNNYQAENMQIHQYNGISYSDVKQLTLDIFEANFYRLSKEASETALQRVEELMDKFLGKLRNQSPQLLDNMNDPDVQYNLYNVQMAYARSGDEKLGERLLLMLLERIKEKNRNLKQLILNEAIAVLPRLTETQLDILTLIFVYTKVKFKNIVSYETLARKLEENINPFLTNDSSANDYDFSDYLYLESLGCIRSKYVPKSFTRNTSYKITKDLTGLYMDRYPLLFSSGVDVLTLEGMLNGFRLNKKEKAKVETLLMFCITTSLNQYNGRVKTPILDNKAVVNELMELGETKELFYNYSLQLDTSIFDEKMAKQKAKELELPEEIINKLYKLSCDSIKVNNAKEILMSIYSNYGLFYERWEKSNVWGLTQLGEVLSHAHYISKIKSEPNLSNWMDGRYG